MKISVTRDEAGFRALRSQWDALLGAAASRSIFLSWEWLTAWWRAYGQPGELEIVTATDGNELVGIAPLRRSYERRFGQRVTTLSFIGDHSNDSDYLDFIVASGREPEAIRAFHEWWRGEVKRGVVLLLNEIPETSPNLPVLRQIASESGLHWAETLSACGSAALPANWDDYLRMLKPRFRTKVRSVLRMLESRGDVTWRFCETIEEARKLHPALFDLHTRRWQAEGKPGVFGWGRKRDFYDCLSPLLLERGQLRFSYLEWRGRPLACQYGFVYDGVYSHLQEGYEPASEHWNVGIGLRAWTIQRFIAEGIREYDFLGGIGRHKLDWGAATKHSVRILAAQESWNNRLFCRGPELRESAKESVRRFLPERLLDARRTRLLSRSTRPSGAEGETSFKSWLPGAIAGGYLHVGSRLISPRFRQHYQLALSGRVPRITRRTGPSGRILYYHRVNDEGDPFFPAISTALFEEQMRVVARRHTVVSLHGLLRHIETGAPGSVVAVTFDDGYQDNYSNALPILERFGLPATIFLTTGSIDSGGPLWFEQLAWALKTTTRQAIDLEIDVPRRLPLTTTAERLAANDLIFGVLRRLPDSDRRDALPRLLAQLATEYPRERGRMLRWDQIRDMQRRGIDFGAHTVSHPFVSRLTPEQGCYEISECKRRIEEELQLPVEHFAYPNGREEDFSPWNKDLLRAAGYRAAVSTIWGMNDQETDRMELRRGQPWETNVAQFACKLDWYQLANR